MAFDNLFGTDGIRATVGTSPFTPDDFIRLGKSLAAWMAQTPYKVPTVKIARDTRESGSFLQSCLTTGLMHKKITVLNSHVSTTPELFYEIIDENIDYGIMITASHNPYHDNGIKIFKRTEGKISLEDELAISELFYKNNFPFSYETLGIFSYPNHSQEDSLESYLNFTLEKVDVFSLETIKLVIDCAHGSQKIAPVFLKSMLNADVIEINNQPNGKNINDKCGALYPEKLQKEVLKHKAHAGFAFDGDGDRLCVVSQDGSILDGDDILAFLLDHPDYQKTRSVVGTVMSNQGFENYVKSLGKNFYRTSVGDKYVLEKMKKTESIIGGEPSGHILLTDHLEMSDGFFTMIRMLELAKKLNDWNFKRFEKLANITLNIPVATKTDLSLQPFANIIKNHEEKLNTGRIVVRYSGTEPLLRIMVEAETQQKAKSLGSKLSKELAAILN